MGLRLSRLVRPDPVPVVLPGGAVWRLRPATSMDVRLAEVETGRQLAGIISGSAALAVLADQLGDVLGLGDGVDDSRRGAATMFLSEINLALACSAGWDGVHDADGNAISEPDLGSVALILSDPVIAFQVRKVVNAGLHAEQDEKNVSAASPNGGAGEAIEPAQTATPPAPPAASG